MGGTIQLTGKHAAVGEKALRDIVEVLDSCGIPYVLEGGTLLGIVRENRLLPWDNDLDLTITRSFAKSLLKNRWRFWLKGYRTRIRTYAYTTPHFKRNTVRILKIQSTHFFFFKKASLMDIFIKDRVGDRYYWTVSEKNPVLKSVPAHFYENTRPYAFKEKYYTIPADYQQYLALRYGDWETPRHNWDFRKDDLCIELLAQPA